MESLIDLRLLRFRLTRDIRRIVKTLLDFPKTHRNGRPKIQNERHKWFWRHCQLCRNWPNSIFQRRQNGSHCNMRKCSFFLDPARTLSRISVFSNNWNGRSCILKPSSGHASLIRQNSLDQFTRQLKEARTSAHKSIRISDQKVPRPQSSVHLLQLPSWTGSR